MKVRPRSRSLLTPLGLVVVIVASASCLLTSNFDGLTGNHATTSGSAGSGTAGGGTAGGANGGGGAKSTADATGGNGNGGGVSSSTSGAGGMGGCTQKNIGGSFPATCVLDDFNRANGSPGSNWLIENAGDYSIAGDRLVTPAPMVSGGLIRPGTALWGDLMGATQEVYVTLSSFTDADGELELILKSQSGVMECGSLQVSYHQGTLDASYCELGQGNYIELTPGGKMVTFNPGDQLGARATTDGKVYGYKNGQLVATWDSRPFSAYALSGRIGIEADGIHDPLAFDDFGGGGQ